MPHNMTTAADSQAIFLGSSKKVTCLSVVVVGAAVVDSGITMVTAAVSAKYSGISSTCIVYNAL